MSKEASKWIVAICLMVPAAAYGSGQEEVSFENDLLTVRCVQAPLDQVFEQIKAATGMELILEDEVKTKRLTADIEALPAHSAIERLLEGVGVNYAMSFDIQNWQRVSMIFIGAGGGGPATPSQPAAARRRPTTRRRSPPTTPADEPEEDYVEDPDDFGAEELPEEMPNELMEGQPDPATGFDQAAPPPPAFPRSRFTPGLESSPFRRSNPQVPAGTAPTPNQTPGDPLLDPFGRPIPNPQQQQQQQQKKEQEKQQLM